ncbi:MAG TPA: thioredoxin family protein [Asticcacaulis sp.]|nr:thioredoxin family protein [Asticcacaulis sp.]
MRSGLLRRFVLVLLALFSAVSIAHAEDGESPHIKAKLVTEAATVRPGDGFQIAIDYTAAPGWHTYWINPGDTGLPPKVKWDLPDGFSVDELQFPTPVRMLESGLMSYGYEGRTILLADLKSGGHFGPGEALPLKAHIDFLVCKDVCIPESLDVSTLIKIGATTARGAGGKTIDAGRGRIPVVGDKDGSVGATVDLRDGQIEFGFPFEADLKDVYFFPAQKDLIVPAEPEVLDVGPTGFTLRVKAAGTALPDGEISGILVTNGSAQQLHLQPGPLAPGVHGLGSAPGRAADTSLAGVLIAMGLAFVGGLILNLMPCVFPVLSMKLLSLSRAGADGKAARSESLIYGAGAVISFVALAVVLDILHRFGASLGWGFQLQSPFVVAGLAVVMLLVALNMSGVFEVGQSLQGIGAGALDQKRPLLSAFLTGVLAVVVAAPCTAPFMATAIGVALAQGGLTNFAIFLALGLGFALPFVALTYLVTLVPGVAVRLPKPGTWMDRLKLALSLLMYAAVIWLVWVFARQVQTAGVILLILALAGVTVAVTRLPLPKLAKAGLLAVGVVVCGVAAALPPAPKPQNAGQGLLPHQDFSLQALADTRAQGKPVLVDLTAAWCVTCKVNERLVLSTPQFAEALQQTGTVYMVGDWTNQDPEISRYLSLFGRSGVPLYVYYGPNNAEPVVLPQILNTGDMVKLLTSGKK